MQTVLFLSLNLWVLFSSHALAFRFCRGARLSVHLITTFLLYVTQVNVTVIFLGVILRDIDVLRLTLLNGFISMTALLLLRKDIKESLRFLKRIPAFAGDVLKSRDYFLYLFLLLFAAQVTATLVKIYYLPPHVHDVFTYHLHPVVEWFQRGEIPLHLDSPVFRINKNPLGAKFFHYWLVVFTGNMVWLELPQFIYGLFLSLGGFALMSHMGVKRNSALRYAIAIYFIPTLLLQSRSCQDHLTFTAILVMCLLYFVEVFHRGKHSRLIFLALGLGLLFGIKKHAALPMFVMFVALLVSKGFKWAPVVTFIKENRARIIAGLTILLGFGAIYVIKSPQLYKNYLWQRPKVLLPKLLPLLLVMAAAAVLYNRFLKHRAALYFSGGNGKRKQAAIVIGTVVLLAAAGWVIKTKILKPETLRRHSQIVSKKSLSKKKIDKIGRLKANLVSFPGRIKDTGAPYSPDLFKISGFGVQFFVFGTMAYLLAIPLCVFKKEYRDSIFGYLVIFSLVLLSGYFYYYFSFFSYRGNMFFPVTGLILWAFLLSRLTIKKHFLVYIDVLLLVMLLFNGAACFYEGHLGGGKLKTLFTMSNPPDRTPVQHSSFLTGQDWEFIDRHIPPGQGIGYYGGRDAWIFPYFGNRLNRKIYFIKELPGFEVAAKKIERPLRAQGTPRSPKAPRFKRTLRVTPRFLQALKERNIHFLHINPQGSVYFRRLYIADDETGKDILKVAPNLYYIKW